MGKKKISFTLTKRVLIVVLIARHYSYNCIKLMQNNEVFYTHFTFAYFIFTTRQAIHIWHNAVVHLCNHCCSRKAINITYSDSVCSLRYPVWTAHAPYFCLWPVQLYYIFPHYLIDGTISEKKLLKTELCFDFVYNFRLKHFSF